MALVARNADASMDASTGQFAPQITGLIAGEDIDPASPCYIKGADGLVYMADGTAENEKVQHYAGFSPRGAKAGQPITIFGVGARFSYGAALTPGSRLFIGATKGRLDDAATVGDSQGVAKVITATDIVVDANAMLTNAAAELAQSADAAIIAALPVVDQHDSVSIWNDGGVLKVSSGV